MMMMMMILRSDFGGCCTLSCGNIFLDDYIVVDAIFHSIFAQQMAASFPLLPPSFILVSFSLMNIERKNVDA